MTIGGFSAGFRWIFVGFRQASGGFSVGFRRVLGRFSVEYFDSSLGEQFPELVL